MDRCKTHPHAVTILAVDRGEVCSACLIGEGPPEKCDQPTPEAVEAQQAEALRKRNREWLTAEGWA